MACLDTSDTWTPPFSDVTLEDIHLLNKDVSSSNEKHPFTLRDIIIESSKYYPSKPCDLYKALYDTTLTNDEVTDALHYASKKGNISCVQTILQHPFYKCSMQPAQAHTRSLWSGAVNDDPSSLDETLGQHTFTDEELRDVLLEAGRHSAFRFLDQYIRHSKVCVDVHSPSGKNILTVLLQQLQKDKSHEDAVLNLVNAIGEKTKKEQAEKECVDPTTKRQRLVSMNVVENWQKTTDEHDIKYKQTKSVLANLGDDNSPLHLAVKCESLPILKSLMKYRDEIIQSSILEECPNINLISTALERNNVPIISHILSHATCFSADNFWHPVSPMYGTYQSNAAQKICDEYSGFSDEEQTAMLDCVVASRSPNNKLDSTFTAEIFKHRQQTCLKTLIEQKLSNVVAPEQQEPLSFQYLLRMAYDGRPENLRLLLAHRHDLEIDINIPSISASSSTELSKLMPREMFDTKFTLLQVSLRTGKVNMLKVLLESEADTTSTDPLGLPLICHNMYYSSKDCLTCLRMLLRYGCDLDQTFMLRDVQVSLLDYYITCSDIFMVQMLYELGASKFSLAMDPTKFKIAHTLQFHPKVSNAEMDKLKDELFGKVHTLYKLCRTVIRKSLALNVEKKIQNLILPAATKEFLNFKELDDMQEKYDKFMDLVKNKQAHDDYDDYFYVSSDDDHDGHYVIKINYSAIRDNMYRLQV